MDKRGKRRAVELGKDLLILVLACTAVYLAARTFWLGGLDLLQEEGESGVSASGEREQSSVSWPVRMAVTYWNGDSALRQGVQYDSESCNQLFLPVASLLREALSGAGAAQAVTEQEWRRVLSTTTNLYFDLLGEVPLSVLSGWLSGAQADLEGTVRRLALSAEGETVSLYYLEEESGAYFVRQTEVVTAEQMKNAAEGVIDNRACFAFEQEQYSGLDGNTMVLPAQPQPRVYSAANPLAGDSQSGETGQGSGLSQLLAALSFPDSSYIYSGTDKDQVVRSGNDTLRVSLKGLVSYTRNEGEQSRYLIPTQGSSPTAFEAAEACRQLADAAAGTMAGEARLYLREMTQTQDGWQVEFGYCLDGAPVQVGESGYAARFQVAGNEITQFTMQLRCYTDTASRSIVLPELLAVAAMEPLGQLGSELMLVYQDLGGDTVSAGWVAR